MPVPSSVLMVKIEFPKTVAYDFHAISSLFHLAFYIRAFAPFELSAPITITHCPGPGGVRFIKHSYYFKPIGIPSYFQPPYVGYRGFSRVSACSITNCRDGIDGAPLASHEGFEPSFRGP